MQDEPKVPEDVRKLAAHHAHAFYGSTDSVSRHIEQAILADRATRPDAAGIAADKVRYRHKKHGTEYVLLGYGKMQAENWLEPADDGNGSASVDMREVAIYRSVDDGSLWVRPREEFEDGRFELLPAAPAIKADTGGEP